MGKAFFIFGSIFITYLLGNYFIFSGLRKTLQTQAKWVRISCYVAYWFGVLLFPLHFPLRHISFSPNLAHVLHEIGTGWLVFTPYMLAIMLIFATIKRLWKPIKHSFLYALAITLTLLSVGFYNYSNPAITEVEISIPKAIDSEQKAFRVVGITDVHLGYGTNKSMLQRYVSEINKLDADLIVISGDLIDSHVKPLYQQKMHEELNQLQAKYGVYVCLGNHEYISNIDSCKAFLSTTNLQLLQDSSITLPNGIQLVGRDDYSNRYRKPIAQLTAPLNKERPILMLDHQPHELSEAADAGVDLQFYGHTHHGQIWPFNFVTESLFELSYGYEQRGNSHIYVSSGLGLWGPPFRIGTKSEIVLFNIKFNL